MHFLKILLTEKLKNRALVTPIPGNMVPFLLGGKRMICYSGI